MFGTSKIIFASRSRMYGCNIHERRVDNRNQKGRKKSINARLERILRTGSFHYVMAGFVIDQDACW